MTTPCRCCGKDITIDLQPRPAIVMNGVVKREAKTPLLNITCWNDCKLNGVTFTVVELADYYTRDIVGEGKYTVNK